jgi:hypothetical protein
MERALIRYFRMTVAAYDSLFAALNQLHGFPSAVAETALPHTEFWPVDAGGRLHCVIDGTYCANRIPASLLTGGGIEEMPESQWQASLPAFPEP